MPPRLAWVLNFDADLELARPGAVTPSDARRARMVELVDSVRGLFEEGDIVLDGAAPNAATRYLGNAFCPTPTAQKKLASMGARVPPFPTLDVLRRVNHRDGQSGVFYFHPWEIDPGQPRQPGLCLKTRVRHYLNLHHMERRLGSLLRDFRWDRMDRVFLAEAEDEDA